MDKQITFSNLEYNKPTKMRTFLEEMDKVVTWQTLIDEIKPFYYNNVRGRKPIELEIML